MNKLSTERIEEAKEVLKKAHGLITVIRVDKETVKTCLAALDAVENIREECNFTKTSFCDRSGKYLSKIILEILEVPDESEVNA